MDKKRIKTLSVMLTAVLLMEGIAAAGGQEKPDRASPALDWIDRTKNPVEWFSWGMDVRLRNDTSDNPYLTSADPPGPTYNFERLRFREWNIFTLSEELEFNLRFTWEGRHYWKPDSKEEWDESEISIDNLNGKIKFQETPGSLTLGRQDIVFGEGWLISDGTPLDGPRTTYFDAVRLTTNLKDTDDTLDLIYINQAASSNKRLAPINTKDKMLMEQDEQGVIAYFSTKPRDGTQADLYFIYKHDEAVLSNGDDGDVYTTGGSLAHDFNRNITGRTEGAYQFGKRRNAVMFPSQDNTLSAWGINNRLTYSFRDPLNSQIWIGYELLSGNDPDDSHNHQFDPLWGRWAKYSELFPNDFDRASDRGNIHRINTGYQFEPIKKMTFQANYNAIFACANRFAGTSGFSDHGKFKGHLLTGLMRYQFNRFWSCYLLGEYFIPGDYYDVPAGGGALSKRDDPATFLRAQIVFTF